MEPKGSMYPMLGYLGFWVIAIIVQVLGKYMIISTWTPRVTFNATSNYVGGFGSRKQENQGR